MTKTVKTLFGNNFIALHQLSDPENGVAAYTYLHEIRSNGHIVAILPYRDTGDDLEFLLRYELVPPWSTSRNHWTMITGGVDPGKTVSECALMELREEAGYLVEDADLISLGEIRSSKGTDTIYHLFGVDLTNVETHEPETTDELEKKSFNTWFSREDLINLSEDALVYASYVRLLAQET